MKNSWAPLTMVVVSSLSHGSEALRENFSEGLAPDRWTISTWTAPKDSPVNKASFSSDYVEVKDGILRLKLTQTKMEDGTIVSVGGEIRSKQTFGYGTYEFTMKASSNSPNPNEDGEPFSGSITGAFIFKDKSQTEIDIEVEGLKERSYLTSTSTWVNEDMVETQKIPPSLGTIRHPHQGFHDYKIEWEPNIVKFYRNGMLIATHVNVVPKDPGTFLFNHWGTNDPKWGGVGTPGVDRYMFVKSFSFTPRK